MKRDTAALLVCAGSATRMGGIHKILHPLGDTTVLAEVLRRFCACESIAEIVLICRAQDLADFQAAADAAGLPAEITVTVTAGGDTRQQSVRNGFLSLQTDAEYAAIHDGARPLVLPEDIERVIADARRTGAASLGVPVKDTVKVVRRGIIAVDPSFIPLGTRVFIPGYGDATADDIGYAIKGNRIDIAFDTHEEALLFGRRSLEIYIYD